MASYTVASRSAYPSPTDTVRIGPRFSISSIGVAGPASAANVSSSPDGCSPPGVSIIETNSSPVGFDWVRSSQDIVVTRSP
ncbi:hypothetical protein SY89_00848 [Halolamina pelagica]|uniref:Uncharacterized protein n=2 Tax=Halolamina pelagica TaxID=699431 RepID=A0A0P7G9V9_9EURY|nr:hypothetical protein SY89_00848 [Halolamina pelagica]